MTVQMICLRDLGTWTGGNTPSKAEPAFWTNGTVPWVSPKDMKLDEIASTEDLITSEALESGRASLLDAGAMLVVTRSGILSHTLPVAITKVPVTINQDLKALSPKEGLYVKYVALAVKCASQQILKSCSKHGTTVASVDTNALMDFAIPVVNLQRQHAVVAEIEKQFSRLDDAVANFGRAKVNLRRYTASMLAAAFTDRSRAWSWATVGDIAQVKGGKRLPVGHQYADQPTTYPYLRVTDFHSYSIDGKDLRYLSPQTRHLLVRYTISSEDVYISIAGTIGQVGRVPDHLHGANLTENAAKICEINGVSPSFLMYWLASPKAKELISASTIATTQAKLALFRIERLPVPVPPPTEQVRIAAEVDRRLSIVRGVEAQVETNLKRAQALRRAILARAFGAGLPAAA